MHLLPKLSHVPSNCTFYRCQLALVFPLHLPQIFQIYFKAHKTYLLFVPSKTCLFSQSKTAAGNEQTNMILIQLFIPNCSLALPPIPRHNSELFSNSFKLPTTAFSNIHSNREIFFNKFSFRSCVVRGNTLWGGRRCGKSVQMAMGSQVGTLQVGMDSKEGSGWITICPACHDMCATKTYSCSNLRS